MDWVKTLLRIIGVGQSATKGYYGLVGRLERRLDATEHRLDECERDRDEMRQEINKLTARLAEVELRTNERP